MNFLSTRFLRCFFALLTVSALILVAACGEDDNGVDPEDEVAASIDEDPRDVLMELLAAAEAEDTAAVYERLASPFHQVEYGSEWMLRFLHDGSLGLSRLSIRAPMEMLDGEYDADQWNLEEHESFTVVRHGSMREFSYVFRIEDDEWRWDPGQTMLGVAYVDEMIARDIRTEQAAVNIQGELDLPPNTARVGPLLFSTVNSVAADDESVEVGIDWHQMPILFHQGDERDAYLHLLEDMEIPLESIHWQSGDESGRGEIVWTSAILDDDALRLPGLSEEHFERYEDHLHVFRGGATHRATVRLLDLPDDVEHVELRVDDIQIGPFGPGMDLPEDVPIRFDIVYQVPIETSSEIFNAD